jgi:hypothetical protein
MFTVIYTFEVIRGKEEQFIKSWKDLTDLIYEFENSFGSRLHIQREGFYVAYAQWPDKETWEKAGANLPVSADLIRLEMEESCKKIDTLYELNVIEDLLKTIQFK